MKVEINIAISLQTYFNCNLFLPENYELDINTPELLYTTKII